MSQLAMKETPGSLLDTEKYRSLFPVPPSARRVWIEIPRPCRPSDLRGGVTLRLEGVGISMGCFCPMSFVILKANGREKCFSLGNREKIVSLMKRKSPRMVFGNWEKDR